MVKYFPGDKPKEEIEMLINPGIPIKAEAMAVHGITPKDVANKPLFYQVAQKLYDFIGDADLAGYNAARYDIPMLMEEFARAGFPFTTEDRRIIDVQRIFYKMEPRTLEAAHRYYCGEEMEGAHDALADVKATVNVLKGQLEMYDGKDHIDSDGNVTKEPVKNDMQSLYEFTHDLKMLDATQRLRWNHEGEVVFNFGKHVNKTVKQVLKEEPNYCDWILNKDFSVQVKEAIKKIKADFNA
jgi:DNA polymerase-3 subunit epsilon